MTRSHLLALLHAAIDMGDMAGMGRGERDDRDVKDKDGTGETEGRLAAARTDALEELVAKAKLLDPAGQEIPDPLGSGMELYQQCAGAIENALARWLTDLPR